MRSSGKTKWFSVLIALCMIVGGSILITGPAAAASGPTAPPDESSKQTHDSVTIGADNEFNPANAVRSGMGTRRNPFVISGWQIDQLRIHDTDKWVSIHDNDIGTLVLDWVGNRVTVKNNSVDDLRVNQNVERTGDMTSGKIVHNSFDVVGQLRHWDGLFAYNIVGTPDSMTQGIPFSETEAVNFDGFNGAHFRNNTIYGFVDATLHGHHHSSGYGQHSHSHAYTPPAETEDAEHAEHAHHHDDMSDMGHDVDHTVRYDEVFISNNKIYSSGPFALRYNDLNHAANDRTATSETNPDLNLPHVHHTHVFLTGNKLYGSGISIEVFNADDEHHERIGHGMVVIKNNEVALTRPTTADFTTVARGIAVHSAQGLELRIAGNAVKETVPDTNSLTHEADSDAGIYLDNLDKATVFIAQNELTDTPYGVYAREMSETVNWWINGLKTTRVGMPVYYDNSVANQPRRQP
jgi:hypothetical protein